MTNKVTQRLFKCLLILLTLNGLSPFTFDFKKGVPLSARTPTKLLIYSIVVSIVLNTSAISAVVYSTFQYYSRFYSDTTLFIMIIIEYVVSIGKGVDLFALHNIHPSKIAKLINQATNMNRMVNIFAGPSVVLSKRVKKIIEIKILSVVIQISAALVMLFSQTFLDSIIFSYLQTLTMLASFLYIFGFMLLSLNFIICINSKLEFMQATYRFNYKKSAYILWSENDVDEVSVLLNKIHEFTITHNGLYGVHLTLTLIGSMALILSSLFYLINSIINLALSTMTVDEVINEYIYSFSNIVFHVIEIANFVLIADATSKEFRAMQQFLLKCSKRNSKTVKKSVEKISMQMDHLNLTIRMCGMAPIQKPMLMAICSTLVSYLTILVQFKLNQK